MGRRMRGGGEEEEEEEDGRGMEMQEGGSR